MTLRELFSLEGKVAVVTGGAVGLGKQMAEALAESGAAVVLAARKVERCEEEAEIIRSKFGVKTLALRCDVTDAEQVRTVIEQTLHQLGSIDILLNNSGITWGAPAEEFPLDKWRKVLDVNVTGSFIAAQQAARIMKARGGGSIINVGSVAGFKGMKPQHLDSVAYAASKAAVINMTRDLAVKWAPYGIRVNAVSPGWFPSHMTEWMLENRADNLLSHVPLGRFGGEDDLKGAVVFLASPASAYVTGLTVAVDGGWTAL